MLLWCMGGWALGLPSAGEQLYVPIGLSLTPVILVLSPALPPLPALQALVGLQALEEVDACGNQLRRGGACALAKACARKPALRLLALDENEISEAGVDALKVWVRVKGCVGVEDGCV